MPIFTLSFWKLFNNAILRFDGLKYQYPCRSSQAIESQAANLPKNGWPPTSSGWVAARPERGGAGALVLGQAALGLLDDGPLDGGEHEVRVLLGGMANEELFFGEDGTTNGAHNDITRVTRLLHHAVAEMGMYRKTRLNYGALSADGQGKPLDDETRTIMEAQSERLYSETRAVLARLKPLTEHLAGKLMRAGEMGLGEALAEIRAFEADCESFNGRVGLSAA